MGFIGFAKAGHSGFISDLLVAFNSFSVCSAPDASSIHLAALSAPLFNILSNTLGFSTPILPTSLLPLLDLLSKASMSFLGVFISLFNCWLDSVIALNLLSVFQVLAVLSLIALVLSGLLLKWRYPHVTSSRTYLHDIPATIITVKINLM